MQALTYYIGRLCYMQLLYIWSLSSGRLGKKNFLLSVAYVSPSEGVSHWLSCLMQTLLTTLPLCHGMRCPSMLQPHRLLAHSLLLPPSFHEEQRCIALEDLPLH